MVNGPSVGLVVLALEVEFVPGIDATALPVNRLVVIGAASGVKGHIRSLLQVDLGLGGVVGLAQHHGLLGLVDHDDVLARGAIEVEVLGAARFKFLSKINHQVGDFIRLRIGLSAPCAIVIQVGREQEEVALVQGDGGLIDITIDRRHLVAVELVVPIHTMGDVHVIVTGFHHDAAGAGINIDVIGTGLLDIPVVVVVVDVVAVLDPVVELIYRDVPVALAD